MKAIITLFIATCFLTSCAKTLSECPPQAQPIIMMFEAVNANNPDPLRSAFSESRLEQFEIEDDWNELLTVLKQQVFEFYATTNLNLDAFQYEYTGNNESGQVVFTYKEKLTDSIDVVKENGKWKMSGPTVGFN